MKIFTRFVSGSKARPMRKLDGLETLARANEVFPEWISPNFMNWGLDEPSAATPNTYISVHEIIEHGTFHDIFMSLSMDLEALCLTQAQIKEFARAYPYHLHVEVFHTFFLFKKGDNFFVARVGRSFGELSVDVCRFEDGRIWICGNVVTPFQLCH